MNDMNSLTNIFSFFIFIIILILFLYFAYKQINHIFKIDEESTLNKDNVNEINNIEKEDFLNLYSLNDFLFDIDEDGNFIKSNKNEEEQKEILEKVIHKKNLETKINETESENKSKNKTENKEINVKKNEEKKNNDSILYIVDKNSNKKHIHFTILNEKKLKYLDCQGFYDDHIVINIKDVKNREITKIINKIYNKYTFVYQTKDDDDAINYFIEYRPSQERFIKLYNQNEDKVFYLEKIFYKENKNKNKDTDYSIPLYRIYHYANEIGAIYSNVIEDNDTKVYQMRLNQNSGNNKNILAFSFILYLSFLKEDI